MMSLSINSSFLNILFFGVLLCSEISFVQARGTLTPLEMVQKNIIQGSEKPIIINSRKTYTCLIYSKYVVIISNSGLFGYGTEGVPDIQVKQRLASKTTNDPACSFGRGEVVLDIDDFGKRSPSELITGGYFLGIYKDFVFLDEGTTRDRPIYIYNLVTGKREYEDTYTQWKRRTWISISNDKLTYSQSITDFDRTSLECMSGVQTNQECKNYMKRCWNQISDDMKPKFIEGASADYQCTVSECIESNSLDAEVSVDLTSMKKQYTGKIFCGRID